MEGKVKITEAELPGVLLVETRVFGDERGFFTESYNRDDFAKEGFTETFVQDSHSRSAKGIIRGLHYQINPAMGKLVRCVRGEIFDACVDIRVGSPTYGKFYTINLSEENKLQLYVPVGFAHGFQALTDGAEVFYKCTGAYNAEGDRGIMWDDPDIGIPWPLADAKVSERDTKHPAFKDMQKDFIWDE